MAKGGTPATTNTSSTTTVNNPQQKKLIKLGMPYAEEFAASGGPTLLDKSAVAGFDPQQTAGQEMVLGTTPTMGNVVGAAGAGNQFLSSGDVLRPDSNPALQATIDASTRPITNQLLEQALPAIRGTAVNTGGFGGSRQGIAEGLATGRAAQAVGDTAAKVATTGYNAGLDSMVKAQQYAPQVAGAQALPGQYTSAVGDVRQNLTQQQLAEEHQRNMYEQTLPLMMSKELIGLGAAIPSRGTSTTGVSTTTPAVPAVTPMQYAGLGVQAAGLFSDPRGKENIVQVGSLYDGTPVFRFTYLGSKQVHIGLMADKVAPEAVTEIGELKFVDYGRATEEAARIGGGL